MVTVKRIWTKSQVSSNNDFLDIWDSGSHLYERWPDGSEFYWKIISRQEHEEGFEEYLEKMPLWESPSLVLHRTQLALQHQKHLPNLQSEFLVGGWQVIQTPSSLKDTEAYKVDSKKEQPEDSKNLGHRKPQKHKNVLGKPAKNFLQVKPQVKPQAQKKSLLMD
jgi:hypothetical protein